MLSYNSVTLPVLTRFEYSNHLEVSGEGLVKSTRIVFKREKRCDNRQNKRKQTVVSLKRIKNRALQ